MLEIDSVRKAAHHHMLSKYIYLYLVYIRIYGIFVFNIIIIVNSRKASKNNNIFSTIFKKMFLLNSDMKIALQNNKMFGTQRVM